MDAYACVRSSRPAADYADTGYPRELSVRLRHVCCGTFVPANDQSDVVLRVTKSIEHRKEALAGNAEDGVYTLNAQSVHQQLRACSCWILVRTHPTLCFGFPGKNNDFVFVACPHSGWGFEAIRGFKAPVGGKQDVEVAGKPSCGPVVGADSVPPTGGPSESAARKE